MRYNKIAVAKIAWSSEYQGGPVMGNHKYLIEQARENKALQKNANGFYALALGHEAFNFRPYKGKMYAYIPPIGKNLVPPKPKEKDDWLVVFVSRVSGNGDLVAVGWYEHASFCWAEKVDEEDSLYLKRKEYEKEKTFPLDGENNHYHYCVTTDEANAHFIPEESRSQFKIDKKHEKVVGRSIAYASGNETIISDRNRQYLIEFAQKVIQFDDEDDMDGEPLSKSVTKYIPPKTELKKSIEEGAVSYAKDYFESRGYKIIDVQKENLGWDLTARKRVRGRLEELHVEVKGTSRDYYHLFLSRNEYDRMLSDDNWRIFVVKDVLSSKKKAEFLDRPAFEGQYEFEPFCFECQKKKK